MNGIRKKKVGGYGKSLSLPSSTPLWGRGRFLLIKRRGKTLYFLLGAVGPTTAFRRPGGSGGRPRVTSPRRERTFFVCSSVCVNLQPKATARGPRQGQVRQGRSRAANSRSSRSAVKLLTRRGNAFHSSPGAVRRFAFPAAYTRYKLVGRAKDIHEKVGPDSVMPKHLDQPGIAPSFRQNNKQTGKKRFPGGSRENCPLPVFPAAYPRDKGTNSQPTGR